MNARMKGATVAAFEHVPTVEVRVSRITRGKGVPWHRAACDDYYCIGHEGEALEYPEKRGRWVGKMYRLPGWAKREAVEHIRRFHEGDATLVMPPEEP